MTIIRSHEIFTVIHIWLAKLCSIKPYYVSQESFETSFVIYNNTSYILYKPETYQELSCSGDNLFVIHILLCFLGYYISVIGLLRYYIVQ